MMGAAAAIIPGELEAGGLRVTRFPNGDSRWRGFSSGVSRQPGEVAPASEQAK
jgi:hypothetical protein